MKVLVQWSLATPGDWVELDLAANRKAWQQLAKKLEPTGTETVDHQPGWVYDVCIQGVLFQGKDHYSAEPILGQGNTLAGVRVIAWNDDPEDWPAGTRYAEVWEFRPGWVDRTHNGVRHQGPDQRLTVFAEPGWQYWGVRDQLSCGGLPVTVRTWAEFVKPAESLTRHGVWLSDDLHRAHGQTRRPVNWREWTPS